MMKCLSCTVEEVLTLSAKNGKSTIEWYIDASFAVHPDFKSHTGASMMFEGGKECVINNSAKQKLNTGSSTTSELVGVDHVLPLVIWVPLFLKAQVHSINENIVYQDNQSAILLEKMVGRAAAKGLGHLTCDILWLPTR